MQQLALDIAAEHFSKREKLIIKRLGEFRTIDADIAHQERLSRGIGLRHQPSVTVSPSREDDPRVLEMLKEPLSDTQAAIAATIAKYVTPEKFRYSGIVGGRKCIGSHVLRRCRRGLPDTRRC